MKRFNSKPFHLNNPAFRIKNSYIMAGKLGVHGSSQMRLQLSLLGSDGNKTVGN